MRPTHALMTFQPLFRMVFIYTIYESTCDSQNYQDVLFRRISACFGQFSSLRLEFLISRYTSTDLLLDSAELVIIISYDSK